MSILKKIIDHKQQEIKGLAERLEGKIARPTAKNFLKAIKFIKAPRLPEGGDETIGLIAEIKKASPSKGDIFPRANVVEIAELYEKSGASAISVLTDEHFFSGSLEDLNAVSEAVQIPVIRKDFIFTKEQILEARLAGADAVLLMTSVMNYLYGETATQKLRDLREYAESFNMQALIETHDVTEIKQGVDSGAKIIGVNSRDFTDLSIDTNQFQMLLPKIPKGIVRVAESGIEVRGDVEKIEGLSDAILVGTAIMNKGIGKIPAQIANLLGK